MIINIVCIAWMGALSYAVGAEAGLLAGILSFIMLIVLLIVLNMFPKKVDERIASIMESLGPGESPYDL